MMRAYSEKYLDSATTILAEMLDYAVVDCGLDPDEFMHMFIVSGIAKQFGRGNVKYVAGRSGIEIADEIIMKIKGTHNEPMLEAGDGKSPEYWAGWALAQYQWYTARPFDDILRYLPVSSIIKLYNTLHEADITKFFEVTDRILSNENLQTNLKRIRTAAGITQEKLAQDSGVTLRSIQMYEQRNKDINKAQAISLARLSRVLGCEVEDLLEPENRVEKT